MGKDVIRVKQSELLELLKSKLKEQNFATYSKQGNKIKTFLSENEIYFLLEILSEVNPDDEMESKMIQSINNSLKDSMVNI